MNAPRTQPLAAPTPPAPPPAPAAPAPVPADEGTRQPQRDQPPAQEPHAPGREAE
jgi:hypothetical protein